MNKHYILLLFIVAAITFSANAQDDYPKNYIGLSSGINAAGLLGFSFEHIFNEKIGVFGNAGRGGWGYKYGAGARLYLRNPCSGSFGASLMLATGEKGIKSTLTVLENGVEVDKEVELNYKPVGVFNLTYNKFWQMGDRNRFNLEVGYSFPLSGKDAGNYEIVTPNTTLTDLSQSVLQIVQPGGLVIGIGFSVGL
jgi:hypothetical protein